MDLANLTRSPGGPLLAIRDLSKTFAIHRGILAGRGPDHRAVDGVDLDIPEGRTTALVGESGCGKTTFGLCLLRLLEPSGGRIWYDGRDLLQLAPAQMRALRRDLQIVFQDPYASLDPRMNAGSLVAEGMAAHGIARGRLLQEHVGRVLERVGLRASDAGRYPHEFSGGQRQRVGIARALALKPRFVVCDEPTSALDVSVQAQILNLLRDLQEEEGLSYLFITHDLSIVRHAAHQVAVMLGGRLMEVGPQAAIFDNPVHPYTQLLLDAAPRPDPSWKHERRKPIASPPGSAATGCPFIGRCPLSGAECVEGRPPLRDIGDGRKVACWRPGQ